MHEAVNLDGTHGFYKAIDLSLRNVSIKIRWGDTGGLLVPFCRSCATDLRRLLRKISEGDD